MYSKYFFSVSVSVMYIFFLPQNETKQFKFLKYNCKSEYKIECRDETSPFLMSMMSSDAKIELEFYVPEYCLHSLAFLQ